MKTYNTVRDVVATELTEWQIAVGLDDKDLDYEQKLIMNYIRLDSPEDVMLILEEHRDTAIPLIQHVLELANMPRW